MSLSVFILSQKKMDVVLMFQFLFSVFLLVFASLNIYYPPSVSPLNLPALRAWEMGHDERQRGRIHLYHFVKIADRAQ